MFQVLILVLASSVLAAAGDVGHLAAAKARFFSKIIHGKHHKRGALAGIPTFKLGHDLPVVSHSVVKPLVVTYPPTSLPFAVKVPLHHPFFHRYPVPVGHKVPVPHPHYGLKFPHHHHTKAFAKPDYHFHHHHHHVVPKPIVPVLPAPPVATPAVPLPPPTLHPLPAPTPPVFVQPTPPVFLQSTPVVPQPVPVAPAPVHYFPQPQLHLRPFYPAPVAVPQAPLLPAPVIPTSNPYSFVLRPGHAVQTSVFATYPRYPFVNFQSPVLPVPVPSAPTGPAFLDHPAQLPHLHYQQEQHQGPAFIEPANVKHGHFIQPSQQSAVYQQDGWSPINAHYPFEANSVHHEESHHIANDQSVPQVYENQAQDEQNYHDLQHQIHQHIQQQIEQAQYDQHNQEYGPPQLPQEHHDFSQQTPDYNHQHQDHGQPNHEYGAPPQDLNQQYGVPQHLNYDNEAHQHGFEGRSAESEGEELKYHNHIPLGFQPPIDRPPENFS